MKKYRADLTIEKNNLQFFMRFYLIYEKAFSGQKNYSTKVARPSKVRKENMSVIVVKKTPDEIAGSNFNLYKISGIKTPKKPERVIAAKIAEANTRLKCKLCCQK